MASVNLNSGAGIEQGFSSLWRVIASQKVVVNTQPISQSNNSKPSYTAKKNVTPIAADKPKFIQQSKKNQEVKTSYKKAAYSSANSNIPQKNTISNTGKSATNYTYTGREKAKTSTSVQTAPAAKYKEANTTKKTAYALQSSERDEHITKKNQAKAKLLQKNQDTQNGNLDYLGTQIDLSA